MGRFEFGVYGTCRDFVFLPEPCDVVGGGSGASPNLRVFRAIMVLLKSEEDWDYVRCVNP